MSDPLKLAERLDLSNALALVNNLREIDGDIILDASEVKQLGALCFQALIAASRTAHATQVKFDIQNVPDKMAAQMETMGLTLEQLMEGV